MDAPERLTCPARGFYFDFLDASAPTYGKLACEECGYTFEVNPTPAPTDVINFAGASEIEAGAAKIRAMVERMKRGEQGALTRAFRRANRDREAHGAIDLRQPRNAS